jgi:hypothetical protein
MAEFERVIQSAIPAIAEIQIDHQGLGSGRLWLFDNIHGSTLVSEQVGVDEVEKLVIVGVWDVIFPTRLDCNRCHSSAIAICDTMTLKKLSKSAAGHHVYSRIEIAGPIF